MGAYSRGGLIRGAYKIILHMLHKNSLSKFLFSIIFKEESKFKYWSLSKSSLSSFGGGGLFDRGLCKI